MKVLMRKLLAFICHVLMIVSPIGCAIIFFWPKEQMFPTEFRGMYLIRLLLGLGIIGFPVLFFFLAGALNEGNIGSDTSYSSSSSRDYDYSSRSSLYEEDKDKGLNTAIFGSGEGRYSSGGETYHRDGNTIRDSYGNSVGFENNGTFYNDRYERTGFKIGDDIYDDNYNKVGYERDGVTYDNFGNEISRKKD